MSPEIISLLEALALPLSIIGSALLLIRAGWPLRDAIANQNEKTRQESKQDLEKATDKLSDAIEKTRLASETAHKDIRGDLKEVNDGLNEVKQTQAAHSRDLDWLKKNWDKSPRQ